MDYIVLEKSVDNDHRRTVHLSIRTDTKRGEPVLGVAREVVPASLELLHARVHTGTQTERVRGKSKSTTTMTCGCAERTSSGPPWHGPRAPRPPWRCTRQPYRPWPWPHHKSAQPSRWPRCGWCKFRTRDAASLETTRYVLRDLLSLVGSLVDSLVSVVGSLVGGLVGVVGSLIGVVLSLLHVRHGRDGVEEKCKKSLLEFRPNPMHPSARGILIQWSVYRSPTICGSDRAKQENMPCSDIIVNAFIAQAKKQDFLPLSPVGPPARDRHHQWHLCSPT